MAPKRRSYYEATTHLKADLVMRQHGATLGARGHFILDRQDALTPQPMQIGLSALPAGRQPNRPLPTRGRGGAAPRVYPRERGRPRE